MTQRQLDAFNLSMLAPAVVDNPMSLDEFAGEFISRVTRGRQYARRSIIFDRIEVA